MPPPSPRRLARKAQVVSQAAPAELSLLFRDWIDLSQVSQQAVRNRTFPPCRTFWLFLAQVLSPDKSNSAAVRRALAWLALEGLCASPDPSAYCQAKRRLDEQTFAEVQGQVDSKLAGLDEYRWFGHPVKVLDGSSISTPDTPANQAEWPQPSAQKPGCGFPVMRIVALFSLATGALLEFATGPMCVGETTLWQQLWSRLSPGDVVLADSYFCAYAYLGLLLGQGVDSVVRIHGRRKTGEEQRKKRLGKGDWLVEWTKNKKAPDWMSQEEWDRMPETLLVRQVEFRVEVPGFRTEKVTVVTTLLDEKRYPTQAFIELYRRRWRVELYLRDLKITMGIDVLRSKTPEMIRRELAMHLIAYNLVRALMVESAREYDVPIEWISFKQSLDTTRQWAPVMTGAFYAEKLRELMDLFLYYLSQSLLPDRPDRSEPRARKRRPKNYQLLNKPRHEFQEIKHRNQYKKASKA